MASAGVAQQAVSQNHIQQIQRGARPVLQTNQPMTIINPPHIRSQSAILPGKPAAKVARIVPQVRRTQTAPQGLNFQTVSQSAASDSFKPQSLIQQSVTPQGMQSFKIVRTPTAPAAISQGQPIQMLQKSVRSQPIPRHLNRSISSSVLAPHVSENVHFNHISD